MVWKARDITDAELAVIRTLWERGPATIRELTELLYENVSQYSTVKKLLERLEVKGCVIRDRSEKVHVFEAAIRRDDVINRRLQQVADALCEGSITPFLTHAARSKRLTAEQRQLLNVLIEDLETSPSVRRRSKKRKKS